MEPMLLYDLWLSWRNIQFKILKLALMHFQSFTIHTWLVSWVIALMVVDKTILVAAKSSLFMNMCLMELTVPILQVSITFCGARDGLLLLAHKQPFMYVCACVWPYRMNHNLQYYCFYHLLFGVALWIPWLTSNFATHLCAETSPEKVLKWSDRLAILIGVAKAVHFLHTGVIPGTFNNRLKTNNILLDEHRIAKLSDYGLPMITEQTEKLEVCFAAININLLNLQWHLCYKWLFWCIHIFCRQKEGAQNHGMDSSLLCICEFFFFVDLQFFLVNFKKLRSLLAEALELTANSLYKS